MAEGLARIMHDCGVESLFVVSFHSERGLHF